MTGYRWRKEEEEMLLQLVGTQPWPQVVKHHRRWAKEQGIPPRSKEALRFRLSRHGESRCISSSRDWIYISDFCKIAGISFSAIRRLQKSGLVISKVIPTRWLVKRAELRRIARHEAWIFAGLPREDLDFLLGTEWLCECLAALPRCWKPGSPRPVRCTTSGKVYSSAEEAGAAVYLSAQMIRKACREGCTAGGKHYEYTLPFYKEIPGILAA